MSCSFSDALIEQVIAFHRHSCPGLAIGIRASEYALQFFPETSPSDLFCVSEKTMCAVDAIQFLTGCSTGKGNLILQEKNNAAFAFYDRHTQKGYRFLFTPSFPDDIAKESAYLAEKKQLGQLSKEDSKRNMAMREQMRKWLMECSLQEVFTVEKVNNDVS